MQGTGFLLRRRRRPHVAQENIGKRINMERTDEALGTGADVVSTACPYCMIMLDDAVRANAREDDVRVLDLSQLVEESLNGGPVAAAAADSGRVAGLDLGRRFGPRASAADQPVGRSGRNVTAIRLSAIIAARYSSQSGWAPEPFS